MQHTFVRWIFVPAASLVFASTPALAQQGASSSMQGGLPAVQAEVQALQAQNASLQQQMNNLQGSISALQSQVDALSGDDGTAQALVGTWTGGVNSVQFAPAVKYPIGPGSYEPFFNAVEGQYLGPTPFFFTPSLNPCTNNDPSTCAPSKIGINPQYWLAKSFPGNPVTITVTRDGKMLSGTVATTDPDFGELTGVALSNNLFLLKVRAHVPVGQCAGNGIVVYQGIGSLSPDRTRMTFTGSAVESDCQHSIFRLNLQKQ